MGLMFICGAMWNTKMINSITNRYRADVYMWGYAELVSTIVEIQRGLIKNLSKPYIYKHLQEYDFK